MGLEADRRMGMPFDADLVLRMIAEVDADLEEDWAHLQNVVSAARELLPPGADRQVVQELVITTLVALLDDPRYRVLDGHFNDRFTTPDQLAHHVRARWDMPVLDQDDAGYVVWIAYLEHIVPGDPGYELDQARRRASYQARSGR